MVCGLVLKFFLCLLVGVGLYSTSDLNDQYIGCYEDNAKQPELVLSSNSANMTIEACISHCRRNNRETTYAGVQNGSKCYCGDSYGKYGISNNCKINCRGNSSYYCGGELQNSIYAVCPISLYGPGCGKECHCTNRMPCSRTNGSCPNGCAIGWTGKDCNTTEASEPIAHQGCFNNNIAYLKFFYNATEQPKNSFMTIQWCMNGCRAKYPKQHYLYAGLQYSYQCTCGNETFSRAGTSTKCGTDCGDNKNCSCSGNSSQICGGGGANNVYSVCQNGYFGPACSQQCHCLNGVSCSMETGSCGSSGCARGWTGQACNIRDCSEKNGDCQGPYEVCKTEFLGSGNENNVTRCRCKKGYNRTMEHENCTDVNECSLVYPNNECNSSFGNCSNTEGSYSCDCYPGFQNKGPTACEAVDPSKEGAIAGSVAGAVIGILVAILLILVLVYFLYWRRRANSDQYGTNFCRLKPWTTQASSPDKDEKSLESQKEETQKSIEIEKLSTVATNQMRAEFKSVPVEAAHAFDYAASTELKKKNKYRNILPYNHNRVKLDVLDGDPLTDYINASFMSAHLAKKVIASHGPIEATVNDFWRMIWEQDVAVVVMITKCVENGKLKCECYWPEVNESKTFGSMSVQNTEETPFADYVIRKLIATKNGERKSIFQCHFLGWPDHDIPSHSPSILNFRRSVRKYVQHDKGIVIHCSAGVGRTGTYIAIDQLLFEAESTKRVDVLGCLKNLREQRMHMIQTENQYMFVYMALAEAYAIGQTHWSCHDFGNIFSSDINRKTTIEKEFQTLENMKINLTDDDKQDALLPQNIKKNRDSSIIPGIRNRVMLLSKESKRNDYINAVYCQSFHYRGGYIQTQVPLPETVVDFWNMCADYNCQLVIVLDEDLHPEFLPITSKPLKFQNVSVYYKSEKQLTGGRIYDLRLLRNDHSGQNKDPNETIYANAEVGTRVTVAFAKPTRNEMLDYDAMWSLYGTMRDVCQPHQQSKSPVVVMCRNGCTYSSVYICLANLADMIESQQEINVFETVYEIRITRPQAIETMAIYEQLYKLLLKRPTDSKSQPQHNAINTESGVYANA